MHRARMRSIRLTEDAQSTTMVRSNYRYIYLVLGENMVRLASHNRMARASILILSLVGLAIPIMTDRPAAARADGAELTLVAYSTPAAAYAQIIPAFQKTPAGNGVTFTTSYGASGDQ